VRVAERDVNTGTWVGPSGLHVRRCRIEVIVGPDAGLAKELGLQSIHIGAGSGCELTLTDPQVSGNHVEIRLDDHGFRLRDLGSTNGTFLGGHRVVEAYLLPGSIVALGDTQLRFVPLSGSVELPLWGESRFVGLIGGSVVMRELFARLARIAATDATVLVTGETGTGKDLVAEAIHESSARGGAAFVVLDCGAIPPTLIESELFGHEKGAFTGATAAQAGAFERADGGTLFLDEIGELPVELQPKLLRVLERKEVRRVGGGQTIRCDVRLVAATNRDLTAAVHDGQFREDLFYRLAVARVHLPPLRERKPDIPLLVDHFLAGLGGGRLAPHTIDLMTHHDWPGNVRELRNVVERAALLAELPTSTAALQRGAPRRAESQAPGPPAVAAGARLDLAVDLEVPFKQAREAVVVEFERVYVTALLQRHKHNMSAAARDAGLDRMTLYKIAARLGLR
jgi:transcriptional regulator with GAF, ATPase, and Fis domain